MLTELKGEMTMREILFRGKRIDSGEWVYGNYGFNDTFTEEKHYIFQNKAWEYPVAPNSIGEFTGLLDRNGKRIFEGDIVRNADGYLFSAQYNFCVKYNEGRFWGDADGFVDVCGAELRYCEVIGNIHDNKSLLNDQEAGE